MLQLLPYEKINGQAVPKKGENDPMDVIFGNFANMEIKQVIMWIIGGVLI